MHFLNERTSSGIPTARMDFGRRDAGNVFSKSHSNGYRPNIVPDENDDTVLIGLTAQDDGRFDKYVEEYRASSSLLITASPVFKRMLKNRSPFLNTLESHQRTSYLRLTDENAWALRVVLDAIHLKEHKVPSEMNIDGFISLIETCSKYDCVHILAPWVKLWTRQPAWKDDQNCDAIYRPICQRDTENVSEVRIEENCILLGLLEDIMEMRLTKIRKLQSIIRELYKHMENHAPSLFAFQIDPPRAHHTQYRDNTTSENCIGTSYYYFINEAQKLSIWRYIDISTNDLRLETAPYSLWIFYTKIQSLLDGMRKVRHRTREKTTTTTSSNIPCVLKPLMDNLQDQIESEIKDASIWETTDYPVDDPLEMLQPLMDPI